MAELLQDFDAYTFSIRSKKLTLEERDTKSALHHLDTIEWPNQKKPDVVIAFEQEQGQYSATPGWHWHCQFAKDGMSGIHALIMIPSKMNIAYKSCPNFWSNYTKPTLREAYVEVLEKFFEWLDVSAL